ncbi:hypothetical protein XENOCAPTIV_001594, partial [Xenoophorus captivus]
LAYALLAAVPPVYGLYSSFYPVLLYTLFGTSRHVSIGTFAVVSLMIGGVAVREAPEKSFVLPINGSNSSLVLNEEALNAKRVQVAVVLTTMVGIIQFVFGLLRFGFVEIYLTEPLVRGFTTAAALHVVISQLKYLLGVKTQRFSGPLSAIYVSLEGLTETYFAVCLNMFLCFTNYSPALSSFLSLQSVKAVFSKVALTNVPSLLLGLVSTVFLYGIKVLNERFKKKLPVPIPGEIIVVIVSTGVSYGLLLSEKPKSSILGHITNSGLYYDVDEYEEDETENVTHEVVPLSNEEQGLKNGELEDKSSETTNEDAVFLEPLSSVHSIILDWTTASFIDSVGAKAIKQVFPFTSVRLFAYFSSTPCCDTASLQGWRIRVLCFALTVNCLLLQVMKEYALVDVRVVIAGCNKDISTDMVFPTVHDAVLHCQHFNSRPPAASDEV